MKILVVEDSEVQQELLRAMFDKIHVDALFVESGEAGLEMLRTQFFDAMFLDLGLPGKNGLEILKIIRNDVLINDLPVVILTADAARETLSQCIKIGITDYITKPIDMKLFGQKFARLRKVVDRAAVTRGKTDASK